MIMLMMMVSMGGSSRGDGEAVLFVGEVDFGFLATNLAGFFVIGSSCFFGSVECAEPDSNSFPWVTNLSCPFAPGALPYSPVEILPLPLGLFLITCSMLFKGQTQTLVINYK